jgi:FMN phosphatase YigB (HAD superfamily)
MAATVTFDFHNTLVRCDPWFDLEVHTLPIKVGEHLGLHNPERVRETYRGLRREIIEHGREMDAVAGVVEAWARLGESLPVHDVSDVVDEQMSALVHQAQLIDGAADALLRLSSAGFTLGVISSAVHHEFLEWSLECLGVRNQFVEIVSSAKIGFYKSRTEIYELTYKRLGAQPQHSVHVGDSWRFDHLTGQAAGLRTIWFNDAGAQSKGMGADPHAIVTHLDQVPAEIHRVLATGAT